MYVALPIADIRVLTVFCIVYLASSDDRTGQIIASAMCSVSASESQVLEAMNWMKDNGLNQHLEGAVESASKGALGDSVVIPWFIAHFEEVSLRMRHHASLANVSTMKIESKVSRFTMRL